MYSASFCEKLRAFMKKERENRDHVDKFLQVSLKQAEEIWHH